MHICILTADYIVKSIVSGHSKKKTNYHLMQVKSIAECSKGSRILQNAPRGAEYCRMLQGQHSAILLTFIKLPFVIKIFNLSFLSGFLRHVLLY